MFVTVRLAHPLNLVVGTAPVERGEGKRSNTDYADNGDGRRILVREGFNNEKN